MIMEPEILAMLLGFAFVDSVPTSDLGPLDFSGGMLMGDLFWLHSNEHVVCAKIIQKSSS